jgi:hypothetical protein
MVPQVHDEVGVLIMSTHNSAETPVFIYATSGKDDAGPADGRRYTVVLLGEVGIDTEAMRRILRGDAKDWHERIMLADARVTFDLSEAFASDVLTMCKEVSIVEPKKAVRYDQQQQRGRGQKWKRWR